MGKRIAIDKISSGYLIQPLNDYYSAYGEATAFSDFISLVKFLSSNFKEEEFERSIEATCALSQAFTAFISCSVTPQLKAIEARINPGVENVVEDEEMF